MTIQELHYSFNLKIDKIDSLSVDSFNDVERDFLLNYAINIFVKQRYGVTNNKQYGFETISKRRDDLRSLHKKEFEIVPTLYKPNLYEAILNDITNPINQNKPKDYWFCTRLRADIKKGDCIKNIGIKEIQTDDLNNGLKYNFYKPSFKWERSFCTFNDDSNDLVIEDILGSIFLYTDNFEILKVYIDYVKKPNKVWIGTYSTVPIGGNLIPGTNQPVQCDLPDHTHEELTTLAASLAQGLISDPNFQVLRQQYIEIE